MRKLLTFLIALGAIVFAVVGPVPAHAYGYGFQGGCGGYNSACSPTTCTQATTVLARYTAAGGSLSGTESSAMTTMVCGLVTDGIITGNMNGAGPTGSSACGTGAGTFDALWIFALNNSTNSFINICSTSFLGALFTITTAATFTADQGWTTTATGVVAPAWTPSTAAGNYVLNSASMGVCVLTADAANASKIEMGTSTNASTAVVEIAAHDGNLAFMFVNDGTSSATTSTTNSQGFWVVTRTGSGARAMYGPSGSSTALLSDTQASTALGTQGLEIGARNIASGISNPASHQYAAAFVGSGLTGAQYASIAARINTYVKAVNGGNGCF